MTPRIVLAVPGTPCNEWQLCCVPLWIEAKAGTGRLMPEQKLFRDDVIERGAFYLEIHDGPDVLIEWFKSKGVRR